MEDGERGMEKNILFAQVASEYQWGAREQKAPMSNQQSLFFSFFF